MLELPFNSMTARQRAVILGIFCLWVTFFALYPYRDLLSQKLNDGIKTVFSTHPTSGLAPTPGAVQDPDPNDLFAILPLNEASIKKVCNATQWNAKLVFTCFESYGGVGNVRNAVLNCLRYTMHAGAGLVLPRILVRSDSDLSDLKTHGTVPLSRLFDVDHFLASMRLSCPQMPIFITLQDATNDSSTAPQLSLKPESIATADGSIPREGLPDPSAWRGQFYRWLDEQQKQQQVGVGIQVVNLARSYMTYPIASDGLAFSRSFASLLHFRADARALATKVLRTLTDEASRAGAAGLEATMQGMQSLTQPILPPDVGFFGVHLRTEADARIAWGFPYWYYGRYENQVEAFLGQLPRSGARVIYVATGEAAQAARFADDVAARLGDRYRVVTKYELLGGENLEELQALTFDQQALVDYMVVLKASDFAGVAHSSFAWGIALKRHQYAKKQGNYLDAPEMLDDDLSKLYGNVKDFEDYPKVLWA